MMYNKDDVIYILENNTTIRKGKIARKQGDNYIIQLIGSCGALTMPEDQLFESEEAAEKSRQQVAVIDADLQFGDMAVFFNLEPQSTIVEAVRDIKFLSPLTLNSYFVPVNDNVRVLCGTKRPELAENVRPKDFFNLLQMARSLYRYVLIDVSSGFNPISVAAADAAERVYLMAMMSGGFELEHIRDRKSVV